MTASPPVGPPAGEPVPPGARGAARRNRVAAPSGGTRRRRVGKPVGGQRLARTIVFGAVAVVVAILWVARELDLDRQELLGFAATSLALVGLFALLGLVAGVLFWLARRARLRRGR